jgi:transcriptional regulator with XRE-family HTH domain
MAQKEEWVLRQKITGVLLRQARNDAGKSLKECGQLLGLSSGAVSAIEQGRRAISLPELEMLAYYLDVPLDHLLNGGSEISRTAVEELPSNQVLLLRHRIVGALLRQARLAMDLSQSELAKTLGISARRLSQYEYGERPVPLTELEALAKILNVPLAHFLDEGVGPVGEQQLRDKEWQQFSELPSRVRTFVVEPANLPYMELAMSLSAVPAEKLRNIAASLLDITL